MKIALILFATLFLLMFCCATAQGLTVTFGFPMNPAEEGGHGHGNGLVSLDLETNELFIQFEWSGLDDVIVVLWLGAAERTVAMLEIDPPDVEYVDSPASNTFTISEEEKLFLLAGLSFGAIFSQDGLLIGQVVPIVHVNAGAGPGGDGTKWDSPIQEMTTALQTAALLGKVVLYPTEVWVAGGTYIPLLPEEGDPRTAAFPLIDNVGIYGGFSGSESRRDQRDPANNETIFSGDIGTADLQDDNCYHVVAHVQNAPSAILDGVTIRDGCANGVGTSSQGGGVFGTQSLATITNCRITSNVAIFGGGLASVNSFETPNGCTISNNLAIFGGGVFVVERLPDAAAFLLDCNITGNVAQNGGGGIYIECQEGAILPTAPKVINTTIQGNVGANVGGGIMSVNGDPEFINCLIVGNFAGNAGGGMENHSRSGIQHFYNCTFASNVAGRGPSLFNFDTTVPTIQVFNSVLWGNIALIDTIHGPQIVGPTLVTYSCVQDTGPMDGMLVPGIGNIDQDPNFADPASGDYRLGASSPCADAGNNYLVPADAADLDGDGDITEQTPLDLDRHSRFQDSPVTDTGVWHPPIVDMGAYESDGSTSSASSLPAEPPTVTAWLSVKTKNGTEAATVLGVNVPGRQDHSEPAMEDCADGLVTLGVQFAQPMQLVDPDAICMTSESQTGNEVTGSYKPRSARMINDGFLLELVFDKGQLPSETTCFVDVAGVVVDAAGQPLAGKTKTSFLVAPCDCGNNADGQDETAGQGVGEGQNESDNKSDENANNLIPGPTLAPPCGLGMVQVLLCGLAGLTVRSCRRA